VEHEAECTVVVKNISAQIEVIQREVAAFRGDSDFVHHTT
jgi:hypothetical protein